MLTTRTQLTSATFTGLLTTGSLADIADVRVEIYRVFPLDSTVPPSNQVPTRVNSPSDVEFADWSASAKHLCSNHFQPIRVVLRGELDSQRDPSQPRLPYGRRWRGHGKRGPVQCDVRDAIHIGSEPLLLLAARSSSRTATSTGCRQPGRLWRQARLSPAGFTDLQTWTRNEDLDPDWLRVGTDIVGGTSPVPTFNAAFSLSGQSVPEPSSVVLLCTGLVVLVGVCRMQSKHGTHRSWRRSG